jgi:hypothetical protein
VQEEEGGEDKGEPVAYHQHVLPIVEGVNHLPGAQAIVGDVRARDEESRNQQEHEQDGADPT